MPVASSSHTVGHAQKDGRRYVRESHVLNVGSPVVVEYLAPEGTDYVAVRTARVAAINEQLAEAEYGALTSGA
jgi:hypothetical protein